MKPPYIAFHLENETLMSTTANGLPPTHTGNEFELDFGTLDAMNERGLDASAMLIGKYVLGMLSIWYPELMRTQYPNLFIDSRMSRKPPSTPGGK